MKPVDAYREGYERGRNDSVGGVLAEITMGMLRDDPGGHFAAGYHDGAAGKKFNPHSDKVREPAAELNPFDDKVAIKTICPNCGALDWFEWRFLGRLFDPVCGHSWYASSGTYALMQFRASFLAGRRFTKYLNSGVSGEGAWIGKALGWFMGTIVGIGCRLEFGVLMIPLQALLALFQPNQTNAATATRVAVISVTLAALGIGFYEIQHLPKNWPQSTAAAAFTPGSHSVTTARTTSLPDVQSNVVSWQPEGGWIEAAQWDGTFSDEDHKPFHAKASRTAQIVIFDGGIYLLWHELGTYEKVEEPGSFVHEYDATFQLSRQGNSLTGSSRPGCARYRIDNNPWTDLNPVTLTGTIIAPDAIQYNISWMTDLYNKVLAGSAGTLRAAPAVAGSTLAGEQPEISGSWTGTYEYDSHFTNDNQPYHGRQATNLLIEKAEDGYRVHLYEINDATNIQASFFLGTEFDAIFHVQWQDGAFHGQAVFARRHYSNVNYWWKELEAPPISVSLDASGVLRSHVVWETDETGKELGWSTYALTKH